MNGVHLAIPGLARRLPFFYGWVVVAVAFVTMGVGVNARTAFSLLFPPILDEFGWERGVTAGAFSFGFLVSAVLSPALGRLMDRRGPLVVMELGAAMMAAGLLLATLVREPWHLYATLGVLVGGGSVCLGYTGQALFLPNWFVRRRGLAMSIAFSGVGVGSIILLPWLQALIAQSGWRAACWTLGIVVLVALAPLNLLLRRRPEELGLAPDGDRLSPDAGTAGRDNVVDGAWAAIDWTLARALRTVRFWWIALGYFCALYAWYAVQVHQTKYLVEIGFSATGAGWALGFVSLAGIPGQIALGHLSDRIGREWVWTVGSFGFALCYMALLLLPGPALRHDLRHADAGVHLRRRPRTLGDRRAARHHRQLRARLRDRHRLCLRLGARHLACRAAQGARCRRARRPISRQERELALTSPRPVICNPPCLSRAIFPDGAYSSA